MTERGLFIYLLSISAVRFRQLKASFPGKIKAPSRAPEGLRKITRL